MGYGLQVFAVDLDELTKSIGSKNLALYKKALANIQHDDDEFDDDHDDDDDDDDDDHDEPKLKLADALKSLIDGGTMVKGAGHAYGFALEALCTTLAKEWLPNKHWSAMHSDWFDTVDAELKKLGLKERTAKLVDNGAPVKMPRPDDFPFIGHMKPTDVKSFATALASASAKKTKTKIDPEVLQSLDELQGWLKTAVAKKTGLVFFYY
jgi:hypothetical protein